MTSVLIDGWQYHDFAKLVGLRKLCKELTQKYNPDADTARPLRPDDFGLTALDYTHSVADGSVTTLISSDRVDPSRGVLICGVALTVDLLEDGYIIVEINGVKKIECSAQEVLNAPRSRLIFYDQAVFAKENTPITVKLYTAAGAAAIDCGIAILGWVAGNKSDIRP